jgi:deoxyribodipyrimidine photo-lyase
MGHSGPTLFWFRRDLRLEDNRGLWEAFEWHEQVHLVFIFDKSILGQLANDHDHRVTFLYHGILELQKNCQLRGGDLHVLYGDPATLIPTLAQKLKCHSVICNEDYEPQAIKRDQRVKKNLKELKIEFSQFKDHVIFAHQEITTQKEQIYRVFTPYKNTWLEKLSKHPEFMRAYTISEKMWKKLGTGPKLTLPTLKSMGFKPSSWQLPVLKKDIDAQLAFFLKQVQFYKTKRDFPAQSGTSRLSPYLRFGLVSIRECVRKIQKLSEKTTADKSGMSTWLSELIWRDFYFMILANFPLVAQLPFKAEYQKIQWLNNKKEFAAWCAGQTGFPIVDAGMRELNQTGWMHNRVRMIVASFLTKILLIDYRWGEKYFAGQLFDFDLAANNGGWQWSASTGCDAVPYFRIFNPEAQSRRFDPDGNYIRQYCPELKNLNSEAIHHPQLIGPLELAAQGVILGVDYPFPLVDYKSRRKLALELFKNAK